MPQIRRKSLQIKPSVCLTDELRLACNGVTNENLPGAASARPHPDIPLKIKILSKVALELDRHDAMTPV
jgi:hypothetical protein